MKIKIENWNGHAIRFVEKEPGDWWGVGIDVARALEYANPSMAVINNCKGVSKIDIPSAGGIQETNIISEIDIYELIFTAAKQSKSKTVKTKATEFKTWVFETIKTLRQASGLEGFQIFRMLDKEHQREAMNRLHDGLKESTRVDYIKANSIANKAISTIHGYPKTVKKNDMPPEWLPERQPILDDAVELMVMNDKFGLGLSVSKAIYDKYLPREAV